MRGVYIPPKQSIYVVFSNPRARCGSYNHPRSKKRKAIAEMGSNRTGNPNPGNAMTANFTHVYARATQYHSEICKQLSTESPRTRKPGKHEPAPRRVTRANSMDSPNLLHGCEWCTTSKILR
jgi:hypothetical protein